MQKKEPVTVPVQVIEGKRICVPETAAQWEQALDDNMRFWIPSYVEAVRIIAGLYIYYSVSWWDRTPRDRGEGFAPGRSAAYSRSESEMRKGVMAAMGVACVVTEACIDIHVGKAGWVLAQGDPNKAFPIRIVPNDREPGMGETIIDWPRSFVRNSVIDVFSTKKSTAE